MGKFNRGGRRDRGQRQMFQATCSECGNDCEIPFQPRGGRPVFCSSCFEKQEKPGFNRPERRGNKRMFSAVCNACGKNCELPFQPTGEKPVYCSQCFNKGTGPKASNTDQSAQQFSKLNSKLDKILEILTVKPKKTAKKSKAKKKK